MTVYIDNEIMEAYCESLLASGLYGNTIQDVARRLIADQLKLLIKDQKYLFASVKGTK